MTDLNDSAYYLRREQQEIDLAHRAEDAGIRNIHMQMAVRYAELAVEVLPNASPTSAT